MGRNVSIYNEYKTISDIIENNDEIYLMIALSSDKLFNIGDKIVLDKDYNVINQPLYLQSCLDINFKEIILKSDNTKNTLIEINGINFYCEYIKKIPRLIIFGAGHIGRELSELASRFRFHIIVVDDRKDLLNNIKQEYITTINTEFNEITNKMEIQETDYIVIVTRGHMYDLEVLKQVINTNPKYLGMIGSKTRITAVKKLLLKEGHSKERIENIFAPIGLKINDNSVEEIALSILTQIIAYKNNKLNKANEIIK